jgi:hypothetical protein
MRVPVYSTTRRTTHFGESVSVDADENGVV